MVNMLLAEKIAKHRKARGWSQEELAGKMGVSRQSVSKWENGTSTLELDKVIKLSEIFEVSTDYLVKEYIECPDGQTSRDTVKDISMPECAKEESMCECVKEPEIIRENFANDRGSFPSVKYTNGEGAANKNGFSGNMYGGTAMREMSHEEVSRYMEESKYAARRIALGVMACILSPVILILMSGLAEWKIINITENMAGGFGTAVLLLIVAAAVINFIMNGMTLKKYRFLEEETILLKADVACSVREKKDSFEPVFKKCIATGVCICIISMIPMFIAAAFDCEDIIYIYCVDLILILVAIGVYMFIWSGMIYGAYQKLLEEGEYTREMKLENKRNANLSTAYWCTTVAIYLAFSFLTKRWDITWVIWPCAGVLFAAVRGFVKLMRRQ